MIDRVVVGLSTARDGCRMSRARVCRYEYVDADVHREAKRFPCTNAHEGDVS